MEAKRWNIWFWFPYIWGSLSGHQEKPWYLLVSLLYSCLTFGHCTPVCKEPWLYSHPIAFSHSSAPPDPLFLVSPLHTAVFLFCMSVGLVQKVCSCLQRQVISRRKCFTARLPSLWLSQSLHLLFCSAAGTWRWGHRCPVWGWALISHLSSALWSAECQFWQSPAARRGRGLQESMGLNKCPQGRLTTCPIY